MGRNMKQIVQAGLPFVIEPVSPERVQLWAEFAGRAETRDAFNVVSVAFSGLWFEDSAYEDFQGVLRCLDLDMFPNAVSWVDSVVGALAFACDLWQRVIASMEQDQSMVSWASRWYMAASEQREMVSSLLVQVVNWVISCCKHLRWELPEETQKYIASH